MKIIQIEQSNVTLPQLGNAPAFMIKESGVTCFVVAFMPDKKDIESLMKGNPVFVQVYKEVNPTLVYTLNDEGEPNI